MSMPVYSQDPPIERWINDAISKQAPERSIALSLQDAAHLALLAQQEADACGIPVVFSLVDACGLQRYYFSMDNALLISHTLAYQKAYTAVALNMPTHKLSALVQPGAELFGLQHEGGICCIAGGIPCWSMGRLLGAIGISGGTAEQDLMIAQHVLERFNAAYYPLTAAR
ncbi:heme-binding protein [Acerihabitans sp. TG2]|uniref:GlcG/HbpS family heme-binding protein n=1 Tax=Acerihabitans sp. TG2 TaxID=3096008 RepID=UPI002B2348A3|nr:heme-binding protein [Acerihabitans sp. TG2]MEA9390218.1 heme-binding protein [Acerihabitans sp. TG2]